MWFFIVSIWLADPHSAVAFLGSASKLRSVLLPSMEVGLRLLLLLFLQLLHCLRDTNLKWVRVIAGACRATTQRSTSSSRSWFLAFLRVCYLENRSLRWIICKNLRWLWFQLIIIVGRKLIILNSLSWITTHIGACTCLRRPLLLFLGYCLAKSLLLNARRVAFGGLRHDVIECGTFNTF